MYVRQYKINIQKTAKIIKTKEKFNDLKKTYKSEKTDYLYNKKIDGKKNYCE